MQLFKTLEKNAKSCEWATIILGIIISLLLPFNVEDPKVGTMSFLTDIV